MDQLDATLLTRIQSRLPIEAGPFRRIGEELGMPEHDVLERVRRLKASGLIRRIGATFRPERLGYVSTLVAVQVPRERVEALARFVGRFDEVTHCYERDGDWNLWFTVTAESPERLAAVVDAVKAEASGCRLMSVPARRRYKLRVEFDLGGQSATRATEPTLFDGPEAIGETAEPAVLDGLDERLVARLCGDLPLEARPFAAIAAELGTTEADVIERVRRFERDGVLRRFGAIVRHRAAGIEANVMVAWRVPGDRADEVGAHAATFDAVTHCYLREPAAEWPYTLYTMIHARDPARCEDVVGAIAARFGLTDCVMLATVREHKKSSMRYFDTSGWTASND